MRCDVNVSVRRTGDAELGTKVEVKNMNSFSAMQKAIDFEVVRQSSLLREGRGGEITQETRLFNEATNVRACPLFGLCPRCIGKRSLEVAELVQETVTMRKKEGLADYRYFPEPDLPPLHTPADYVADVAASMAELPAAMRVRLVAAGLTADVAAVIAEDVETAHYFDASVAAGADVVQAANWVQRDLMAWCKAGNVRRPLLTLYLASSQTRLPTRRCRACLLPTLAENAVSGHAGEHGRGQTIAADACRGHQPH